MRDSGKKSEEGRERWNLRLKSGEAGEKEILNREQEKKKKVRERGTHQNESEEQKWDRDENRKGLTKGKGKNVGINREGPATDRKHEESAPILSMQIKIMAQ